MRTIVVGLAICVAGCLVSRRTSDYECDKSTDCNGGRTCNQGFCVTDGCPAICTSCDTNRLTCTIACDKPGDCSTVTCPSSYACDITCAGGANCGAINCGFGACTVRCEGPSSCGAINCLDACSCDVSCPTGNCGTETCPATSCESGSNCSSAPAGCNICT